MIEEQGDSEAQDVDKAGQGCSGSSPPQDISS